MESNKIFNKYYKKLSLEGWIKSGLIGFICGFAVSLIISAVFWAIGFKLFWISIIALFVIAGAVTPTMYFKVFKPTTRDIARRVDSLGLEERLVTMEQLKNDDSFIAMKQREDAMKSLSTVQTTMLKIAISVPLIVAISVVGFLSVGMTTVSGLMSAGVIKSGKEIIEEKEEEDKNTYEITYEVEGNGEIMGDIFQVVKSGENGTEVVAVAEDGWAFLMWSDQDESPYRQEINVHSNITLTAIFAELEEGEGEGDGNGEGDSSNDEPGEGEGEGRGKPNPNAKSGSNEQGTDDDVGGYKPYNIVRDGNTDYSDIYGDTAENASETMNTDGTLSQDKKSVIENYMNAIGKNKGNNNN